MIFKKLRRRSEKQTKKVIQRAGKIFPSLEEIQSRKSRQKIARDSQRGESGKGSIGTAKSAAEEGGKGGRKENTEKRSSSLAVSSAPKSSFALRLRRLFGDSQNTFTELAQSMEEELLLADFGTATTKRILEEWRARTHGNTDRESMMKELRIIMQDILAPIEKPLVIGDKRPFCLMMVGTNGVGKTTTLAKIANHYKRQGHELHLVAGDTFRAAAVDQLKIWAERLNLNITYGKQYVDSAAVIYDGIQEAQSRAANLIIIDTAGMMTSAREMSSYMQKISAVIQKLIPAAPHETLLVLDASHGQSSLIQAQGFRAATQVSGFCLTKMDGSAKGGIAFAVAVEHQLPLRFLGTGEKLTDLEEFNSSLYLDKLLNKSAHP